MNFDKLFFRLLIIKSLYQYCLSQLIEVAPLSKIIALNDGMITYLEARLSQYGDGDRFHISASQNPTLNSIYFEGDFRSTSIEFNSLYDLEMEFFYRRQDNIIVWFKCFFSEKKSIQAFFRKIYSYQQKGDSVMILRIARYSDKTRKIESYVKHATMYSKNINEFTNGSVKKTYFITHFNETNSTMEMEADFIFPAESFVISDIYKNNKIALCIAAFPNERFLISFSYPTAGYSFLTAHMPKATQRDNFRCDFPENLTAEQIFNYLDSS